MRTTGYIRISTADQNSDLQRRALSDYADRQSLDIIAFYEDSTSGTKTSRPALDQLMADARARKFDCVLVWKLDRFGRNLLHCLACIQELQNVGVRFIAVTQGLDTDKTNPASQFLLHVLAAAAEFERSLILERTQAGRMRYREDFDSGKVGKTVHSRSGKDLPPHRPRKIFDRAKVAELRDQGQSLRQIARTLKLGLGTVAKVLAERSKTPLREKDKAMLIRSASDQETRD